MKTILFPTDFSDAATRAFIYALHLARKFDATIITLHAFDKPNIKGLTHVPRMLEEFYNSIDLYEFENYKSAIPVLYEIQEKFGFTDIDVKHTIYEGQTEEVILERAKGEKAELIVMGTTGARGLKEILLGSTTGEILENADCPVLAVPEQAVFDGLIDKIAFTVSFSDDEMQGLTQIQEVFAPFNPLIHCVNIDLEHTGNIVDKMNKFAANFESQPNLFFTTIDGADFKKELTQFLEKKQVDIVAMVTHKRNFFEELFHYSVTKTLSYHSHTPILSIKPG